MTINGIVLSSIIITNILVAVPNDIENESGDLNLDGYINVSDIVMLVNLIINPE